MFSDQGQPGYATLPPVSICGPVLSLTPHFLVWDECTAQHDRSCCRHHAKPAQSTQGRRQPPVQADTPVGEAPVGGQVGSSNGSPTNRMAGRRSPRLFSRVGQRSSGLSRGGGTSKPVLEPRERARSALGYIGWRRTPPEQKEIGEGVWAGKADRKKTRHTPTHGKHLLILVTWTMIKGVGAEA